MSIPLIPYEQYRRWLAQIVPPWLQQTRGQALMSGLGEALDNEASLTATGVLARFITPTSDDSLPIIGSERLLNRYPGESIDAFRQRVLGAWDFWVWAGTEYGLSIALAQLGYDSAITPVWSYDSSRWSEFEVFIYPATRSYDGTQEEKNRILGVVNQIKPAHTKLAQLTYVSFGPLTWDPPGLTWDPPGQVWGDTPIVLYP